MVIIKDRRNVGQEGGTGANVFVRVIGASRPLNDSSVSQVLILVHAHDENRYRTTDTLQGIPATVLDGRTLRFPLRTDFFGQQSTDGFQDPDKIFSLVVYILYSDGTSEAVETDTAIKFIDTGADQLHPTPPVE